MCSTNGGRGYRLRAMTCSTGDRAESKELELHALGSSVHSWIK